MQKSKANHKRHNKLTHSSLMGNKPDTEKSSLTGQGIIQKHEPFGGAPSATKEKFTQLKAVEHMQPLQGKWGKLKSALQNNQAAMQGEKPVLQKKEASGNVQVVGDSLAYIRTAPPALKPVNVKGVKQKFSLGAKVKVLKTYTGDKKEYVYAKDISSGLEGWTVKSNLIRKDVTSAISEAASVTGIDSSYLMAVAAQESNFNPAIKASTSSATGLYQFIDQTWLDVLHKHGAKHGYGHLVKSIEKKGGRYVITDDSKKEEIYNLRKDPRANALMGALFQKDNKTYLEKSIGKKAGMTDLYLAHFLGPGGAKKFLKALGSGKSAADVMGAKVANANAYIFYKSPKTKTDPRTVAEVYALLKKKITSRAKTFGNMPATGTNNHTGEAANSATASPLVKESQAGHSAPLASSQGTSGLNATVGIKNDGTVLGSSSDIKMAQSILRKLGYYKGVVDGYLTRKDKTESNTTKAIKAFQSDYGLVVDGIIGEKTRGALSKALSSPGSGIDANAVKENKPIKTEKTPVNHPVNGLKEKHAKTIITEGISTTNFSIKEFHCNDGTKVPEEYHSNVKQLMLQLEVLRGALGDRSIKVNSGYRSPGYNKGVGGAKNSQHLLAKAADIVVSGFSPKQVKAKIIELINKGKMKEGGVGLYNTFVHYDIRGSKARWQA